MAALGGRNVVARPHARRGAVLAGAIAPSLVPEMAGAGPDVGGYPLKPRSGHF
jgi:hypothetical protein